MGEALSTTVTAATNEAPSTGNRIDTPRKELLQLTRGEWGWALAFMLSMSMIGLKFPIGYITAFVLMAARYRSNRYDFLMMFTIFMGGYGVATFNSLGIGSQNITLLVGIAGYLCLKKYPLLNKSMAMWGLYGVGLIMLAMCSIVSMNVQFPRITRYLSVIYFIFPLLFFSGRPFDIRKFWRAVMPYVIIMGVFYIIDGFIFCGNVLVPCTHLSNFRESTFNNLVWRPLSMNPARKYPVGIYLFTLAVIPLIRVYRLRAWQWLAIIGGMISTFTFTVISGLVLGYMFLRGNLRQTLKWGLLGLVVFPILYFVDGALPSRDTGELGGTQSFLRIKSSVDQIIFAFEIQDEEDLAKLGTSRMGQAIPKIELLYDENKQWTGFGFLDVIENTPSKYIIYNDLYFEEYSEDNWEVANNIEVSALEVFTSIGWIGLALHIAFFVGLYLLVRKKRDSVYFLSVMVMFAWFGIGGFDGLVRIMSLYLVGLTYGIVLLTNRPDYENADETDQIAGGSVS
ncbi:MAG: efflux RND transporter permease subunit [Bacteroidales bacterium]|nr:efflux RND transporter permease subunit [Bacteroidales bacterium]